MNKAELVSRVAAMTGFTKKDTELTVNTMLDAMQNELAEGGKVQLIGFGTFEVRERKERIGRNPQNPGVEVTIPASVAPVFKAGKALKDAVNK